LIVSSVIKTNKPAKKKTLKVVKTLTVSASAYTMNCRRCSGITAIGINLKKNPNQKVISVDPKVIKLGTKVYVEGYGYAIAADKGSSIKGNKIDIFVPSYKAAIKWGRRTVKVKILN
jgi:3D (Asp-Asp-Asp) domain-containing protein